MQVKAAIENSVAPIKEKVKNPETGEMVEMETLSRTGGVVNAYTAVKNASEMAATPNPQFKLAEQQKNQKKNDDKKDKDKDKKDEQKDKKEKDKEDIKNPNNKEEQAPQPAMSKEQAEKMLNALKNDEKKMHALRKKKGEPGQKVKVEKDW